MTYPVLISLKGRRHDYLIRAGDNEKSLARVKRHGRYSRFWFTKKHFKELGIKPSRSEFIAYHRIFNPARIVGYAVLVTPEGAREIATAEQEEIATKNAKNHENSTEAMPMTRAYAPMANSALRFTAADRLGNGLVNFALAYPADMQGVPLDVVGCSSISCWNWQHLFSTNAPLAGFTFSINPQQSPCRLLSCYRTDLPAGDSDGDGVTDGDEMFFDGTDKNNPDTDGDGLNDGDERQYGTDPLDSDSDNDSVPDGVEVQNGSVPTDPDDNGSPQKCVKGPFEFYELLWPEYVYNGVLANRLYCAHIAEAGYSIYNKDWYDTSDHPGYDFMYTWIPLVKGKQYTFTVENIDVRNENDYYDYTVLLAGHETGYEDWGSSHWGVYIDNAGDLFAYERLNVNPEGKVGRATVLDVDLISSKVNDENEDEKPGCIMCVSTNLEQFDITIPPDVKLLPNLNVTFDWNTYNAAVWLDQSKTIPVTPTNSWPVNNAPASIYVEGLNPGQMDLYARLVPTKDHNGDPIDFADLDAHGWPGWYAYDRIKVTILSVGLVKFKVGSSTDWKEFTGPQKILLGKETHLLATNVQPPGVTFPSGMPKWEGTFGVTASGLEVSHTYSGVASTSDTDTKTVTTDCGPAKPEEFLVCTKVLGIHSNVDPDAGFTDGHAWISVTDYSSGSPVTDTYGLWPDAHPLTVDNGTGSDVRINLEPAPTGKHNRYYLLSPSEWSSFVSFKNISAEWTYFNTCANWAEDAVQATVGETVDSSDRVLFGTPRAISKSVEDLETDHPTSPDKPLDGGEDASSTTSGSGWDGSSFIND